MRNPISLRLPTALLVTTLTVAACSGDPMAEHSGGNGGNGGAGASAPSAAAANSADVMFAQMMIPHHAQAIEMSEIVLAERGIDRKVRAVAERVKAAQAPEIAEMRGWLDDWGKGAGRHGMDHSGDAGMSGMMSAADMAKLEKATGSEATRIFLTGMVAHHRSAIAMAKMVLAQGRDPQVQHLAEHVVTDQKAEITEMNQLLKQ
jgi:uncharacterized protein (DUF305 family)